MVAVADVQDQVLDELSSRLGRRSTDQVRRRFRITPGFAIEADQATLDALADIAAVRRVIPDRLMSPSLDDSVPLIGGANVGITDVVPETPFETGIWGHSGKGTTVAIIDTGIDAEHPFFGGRVVREACFSVAGANSFCPGGVAEKIGPGAASRCEGLACGHGTHVAGIAAGSNDPADAGSPNGGVAPNSKIAAIQVFHRETSQALCDPEPAPCTKARVSNTVAALEQVALWANGLRAEGHPVAAANMSLGGGRYEAPCPGDIHAYMADRLLYDFDIAVVAASGNDGYTNALNSPACIPSVVSVGNTTLSDQVTSLSNSAPFLNLLAPGSSIFSAEDRSELPSGYFFRGGTSMAAPHVAGAIAVLRSRLLRDSAMFGATPTLEIVRALDSTGTDVTDSKSGVVTPRINVDLAMGKLANRRLASSDSPAIKNVISQYMRAGEWFFYTVPAPLDLGGTTPILEFDEPGQFEVHVWSEPLGPGDVPSWDPASADACRTVPDEQFRCQVSGRSFRFAVHASTEGLPSIVTQYITNPQYVIPSWFRLGPEIFFGATLDAASSRVAVGAPGYVDDPLFSFLPTYFGAVSLFEQGAHGYWRQTIYKLGPVGDEDDAFGGSVALEGDVLIVGAPLEDSRSQGVDGDLFDNSLEDSGAAFVYERVNGSQWEKTAYLKASNPDAQDFFGARVATNGTYIAVSAPGEDGFGTGVQTGLTADQLDNSASSAGAVYLYQKTNGGWEQTAYIKASNTNAGDRFGTDIALSENALVVGAEGEDSLDPGDPLDNSLDWVGAAYVFNLSSDPVQEIAYVKPPNAGTSELFGGAVAIHSDTLVVGARGADGRESQYRAGAAYVYSCDASRCSFEEKLQPRVQDRLDVFGTSVSIYGDDIVIGADREDSALAGADTDRTDNSAADSGAGYLFREVTHVRTGQSEFHEFSFLKAINADADDSFGSAISQYANQVFIGAPGEASGGRGLNVELDNSWPKTGAMYAFSFGRSVAGTVIGLETGEEIRLEMNVSSPIPGTSFVGQRVVEHWIRDNGTFMLPTGLAGGDAYEISVVDSVNIDLQECTLINGLGVISDRNVEDVIIDCSAVSNSAPIASNDALGTNEDTMVAGSLFDDNGFGQDSDPDGHALVVAYVNGSLLNVNKEIALSSGGKVWVSADGTFQYDPREAFDFLAPGESGTDGFRYSVYDGIALDSAEVSMTVTGVNDPPVAVSDEISIYEDNTWFSNVLFNDSDAEGPLTVRNSGFFLADGLGGEIMLEQDGDFQYRPPKNAFGTDSFDYSVEDRNGAVDSASVEFTVLPVNDPPVFQPGDNIVVGVNQAYSMAWATGITTGPPNESGQTLDFFVNATNSSLFSSYPTMQPDGVLSFATSDSIGQSDVFVQAVDDGGFSGGGNPYSEVRQFQIQVAEGADLTLDKVSNSFFTPPGGTITYELRVSNWGPNDVVGARIQDPKPARLTFGNWECAPTGLATCDTATGTGPVDVEVTIPAGDAITVTVDAQLTDTDTIPVTNTATVTVPSGVTELAPADNADSDTDAVGMFVDSFETEEPD